jgi:bifunctional non-homologous end joining protein LigD
VGPAQAAELRRVLEALSRADSPFDDPVPKMDAAGTEWVQPRVVVEVRHLGRTPAGRLRQPVFRGVRSDLDPADVRPE